jgi:hypothetical protein
VLPGGQAAKNLWRERGIYRRRSIPVGFHARLSRSSATALAIASGSSR